MSEETDTEQEKESSDEGTQEAEVRFEPEDLPHAEEYVAALEEGEDEEDSNE